MALTKISSSGITDSAITTSKILDGTIINADIAAAAGIEASKFGYTSVQPTVSSFTPSIANNASLQAFTITGSGFVSVPRVEFINQSTNATTNASVVSFTSSTQIIATMPAGAGGDYKIRVENPGGLATTSGSAFTFSGPPTWTTSAGSLGEVAKGGAISLTAYATEPDSGAISYTHTSGSLPPGAALSVNNSIATISGTHTGSETSQTAYTFSLEATDPESQSTTRSFSITITVGLTNGGGFC
jgi:hypothetical protein